ncbi:MAG: hypothetical protein LH466_10810 [Sphingomonas bacterium]|nr:hypothetical protein [Sphingomonas bacterium]
MPDYFKLSTGNFAQDWSNTALLSATDDWSRVTGIVGYRGDDITSATGANPGTLTGDGTVTIDVNVNQVNPNTNTTGGVTEFEIANPVVALQGSGTADAPSLVFHLDTTGREQVVFSFNAPDIDGSPDKPAQQIAVQYRVGVSGAWINLPAGYIADATSAGSATQSTAVSVTLPASVNGQSQVQVRVITANAVGNDEWVGIDDILVTSQPQTVGPIL